MTLLDLGLRVLLGLALGVLSLSRVISADSTMASTHSPNELHDLYFDIKQWGVAEGLPGSHVNAIAQDAKGFLWIGTLSGLLRFDGKSFEVFDDASGDLPSGRITVVHIGPTGRMWIGTEQGHLIEYRDGSFHLLAEPPYPGSRIASLAEDAAGNVWFSRYGDPSRPDQPLVWQWTAGEMRPRADLNRYWIAQGADGKPKGLMHDGQLSPFPTSNPALAFTRDGDGNVWGQLWNVRTVRLIDGLTDPMGATSSASNEVTGNTLLTRANAENVDIYHAVRRDWLGLIPNGQNLFLVDRRGLAWTFADATLRAYRGGHLAPVVELPLGTSVREMTEDREGNLWVGTMTRGLLRVSAASLHVFTPEDGVPLPGAVGITAKGEVFLEPAPAEICRPLQVLRAGRAEPLGGCGWMLEERGGMRWHLENYQLVQLAADGPKRPLEMTVNWMVEDPKVDGVIWVVGQRALVRLDARGPDPVVTGSWELVANRALIDDGEGGIWIGGQSGLWHLSDDTLEHYGRQQGLPVDNVRAVISDGANGLWIGTYGGGLVHFDGSRFVALGVSRGLPEVVVSSLVKDRFGALWFAGNRGIHRLRLDNLERALVDPNERLAPLTFGSSAQLINPETTGRPGVVGLDGRIWFATFSGLVVIDPSVAAAAERSPPSVFQRGVETAEGLQPAGAHLSIADDANRDLRFAFTALHFAAPESLAFRYRLEPLETDWVYADETRSARYRELPPGEYRFRVQSRHSAAIWQEADASQSVSVLPKFAETNAFLVLIGLTLFGLIAAGWRLSTRQIRRRALALEAAVNERTQALAAERDVVARQATRLGELAEARSQFMAGISHELRTPLTLILGPLHDLREQRLGSLNASALQEVDTALRHAERLRRLVDRLLGVSRSEQALTRLLCRPADIGELAEAITHELQPLASARGSRLELELPDKPQVIWFDQLQMESVLINLIANALKHTPQGSHVRVRLHPPVGERGDALIEVMDNGPGIPAAELPRLFERFFRGSASGQQAEGGFGLGLALVREVIERHGGSIAVRSDPAGTVFSVRLRSGEAHLREEDRALFDQSGVPQRGAQPVSLEETLNADVPLSRAIESSASADARTETDHTTILIVDDNAELRRLVRRQLEPAYQIIEAADGLQALALINQRLPDLVLSDVMMPGLDGIELCRAIRQDPATDFVPVVLLTARASADAHVEGLYEGADAYLAKPFNGDVLRATVGSLIASRLRLRERYAAAASPAGFVANEVLLAAQQPSEQQLAEQQDESADSVYCRRLNALIQAHLHDEEFSTDQLAEALHQSRTSLYRHSKRLLNDSPSELIRLARLERAAAMLHEREGSVSEVAYAVGFKSVAHFSNAFLGQYGQRPSEVLHASLSATCPTGDEAAR